MQLAKWSVWSHAPAYKGDHTQDRAVLAKPIADLGICNAAGADESIDVDIISRHKCLAHKCEALADLGDFGMQLAAAGADETTRSRLGRISIAGILMWPAFGFNLVYTVGAVIVLTIISLVSRLFETQRPAAPTRVTSSSTTTTTAPRSVRLRRIWIIFISS